MGEKALAHQRPSKLNFLIKEVVNKYGSKRNAIISQAPFLDTSSTPFFTQACATPKNFGLW